MKPYSWILLALILILLAIATFRMPDWRSRPADKPAAPSPAPAEPKIDKAELERRFRAEISLKNRRYRQKNEELLRDFLAKLSSAGESSFQTAQNNVETFVQRTTKISFCTVLVYKAAKDKLTDSSSLSEALDPIVREELLQPLGQGQAAIDNELQNFMLRLQENHNQYCAEVMELANRREFRCLPFAAQSTLPERLNELGKQLEDFAISKITTAISVGLEVAFAQSLYACIRSVAAHAVAKLAGTVSTSAICAAADGPFPVGDAVGVVVGVGGLVWTGYDIYQVSVTLPEELRRKLYELIRDSRAEFCSEAERQAREAVRQANEAIVEVQ